MEVHAHGFLSEVHARLLAQRRSESLGGPVRSFHTDVMRIALDHAEPFGIPGRCDPSLSARGGARWHGIPSTAQEALAHAHDGVLAAHHGLGNLARRLASQREHEQLVACARFGIGWFFIAPAQLGQRRLLS